MLFKRPVLKIIGIIFSVALPLMISGCATTGNQHNTFNYALMKAQFDKSLIKKPKWDGLYIKTTNGLYEAIKPTIRVSVKRMRSMFTGQSYIVLSIDKKFLNNIPSEEFQGFYFRGAELISPIEIYRVEKGFDLMNILTSNIIAFNFRESEYKNNLFTEFKCISNLNSLYCEPNNVQAFLNYLKKFSNYNGAGCIMIHAGKTQVKYGGKGYFLCFR